MNQHTHDSMQRQANIALLHQTALRLRDASCPGVQLWQQLTAQAVSCYQNQPNPQQASDWALQDLAIVILGPFALKYLRWFDKLTPDWVQDPLVNQFFDSFSRLGLPSLEDITHPAWWEAGYAGKLDDIRDPGLDRHFAADFRPAINDHTDNQIFHTFFYHFMAYVTQATWTIRAASVYHELFDKGGSTADHTAALLAIHTGTRWRQWRDSPQAAEALSQWPATIGAAYGADAALAEPLAATIRQETDQLLQQPNMLDDLLRKGEYTFIRWRNGEH